MDMEPKIKYEPMDTDSDNEDVTLPLRRRAEEINNALYPTPKKRGRTVGSGANETRKADEDYSTNANTVRARKRQKMLTPAEAELQRVKNNLTSAMSKARKKVRENTPNFNKLPKTVQDQLYDKATNAVKEKAEQSGYTVAAVRSKLEIERDLLRNEIDQRHRNEVKQYIRKYGAVDDSDDELWDNEDDEVMGNEDDPDQDDQHRAVTGSVAEAVAEAFQTAEEIRYSRIGAAEALDQYRKQMASDMERTHWLMFRQGVMDRLCELTTKEDMLKTLTVDLREWMKLVQMDCYLPEKFFSKSDKALLRFAIAVDSQTSGDPMDTNDDQEWVDLPGIPGWWPDVTGDPDKVEQDARAKRWYMKNGFDIFGDEVDGYVQAAEALKQENPPPGWFNCMVHSDGELIWDVYRSGAWKTATRHSV